MIQLPTPHCDSCGLPINLQAGEHCPRCNYPVNPTKEEQFLVSTIHDLERVATFGGANLTVVDLMRRYQSRLNYLQRVKLMTAQINFSAQSVEKAKKVPVTNPFAPPVPQEGEVAVVLPARAGQATAPTAMQSQEGEVAVVLPARAGQATAPTMQGSQAGQRRVFSWRSFFADQTINIVASLGAFLILVGALSFIVSTPNLVLSFLVVFIVHAVFGITGISTYRFPNFRVVSTIYTVIFALLVPLAGFSAYQLVTNNFIEFSVPILVAIAAIYAAIVYILLAVYQRFIPFAYLGMVALVVADLAIADAFKLGLWWWASALMLLALLALVSVQRPGGNIWPFSDSRSLLREPVRILMYSIVTICVIALFFTTLFFVQIDVSNSSTTFKEVSTTISPRLLKEVHFSILSMTLMLTLWTCLFLWLAKRARYVLMVAYLLLACLLAFCYAFEFQAIGYAVALTVVALLYHGLSRFAGRFLQPFGKLGLGLDQIALGLVFLVPWISAPLLPSQLLARVYSSPVEVSSALHFQTSWQTVVELIIVALGLFISLSVALSRAGLRRTPTRAAWCWVLLLSGFLLNWEYSLVVLALNVAPAWWFLGLTLALVAGAVVVRQRFGAAWANPLDVLALSEIIVTLSLSLNLGQDAISALLLFFAVLSYGVLLYQRRQNWLFLPLLFAILAYPWPMNRPLLMLSIGLLLPIASVVVHRFISDRWHGSQASAPKYRQLLGGLEWPLLVIGLLYGIGVSVQDATLSRSAIQSVSGLAFPVGLEIALLSLIWYASAALSRMKLWLVPAIGFAVGAVLIPTNSFWVLMVLTPVAALLAVGVKRFAGREWALPLYIVALLAGIMTGYTGFAQNHVLAASWALLGFAALAYVIGIGENMPISMWTTPIFATWSVIDSAGFLGDLYRPPIIALVCAGLGVTVSFLNLLPLPFAGSGRRNKLLSYALPLYATALAAAILTGVYGTLSNINTPFYGAIPDALLVYAVVAFAVLVFERQPRWLWLVAGFAIWGTLLALQLTAYYMLGIGIGAALAGVLVSRVIKQSAVKATAAAFQQALQKFTWSWPWYGTTLLAAVLIGSWASLPVNQPMPGFIAYSLLAFTAMTLLIMLVERVPEMLVFPAGLAAWAIWQWQPHLSIAPLMIVYTLLCVLIFASQLVWRIVPSATQWLPATRLHNLLGIGGQVIVVLAIIGQGGVYASSGFLAHVGAGALLVLAGLVFWFGFLQQAKATQHWCNYASGLLLSLVVSWELSAFGETRLDVLLLTPASYLLVLAPFLMRDEALPERHRIGQVVALLGASLLLLPTLWLSFNDSNLLSTLILIGEALALLLLGIVTRVRSRTQSGSNKLDTTTSSILVYLSVSMVIVGAMRALFLTGQGVPLILTAGGLLLVAFATGLKLASNRFLITEQGRN